MADNFQDMLAALQDFWAQEGCVLLQPLDMEVGAATFHPGTLLRALGPACWRAAYCQPCRRPKDGRYGQNPNRLQRYYQYQVVLKPDPENIQALYLASLERLGIHARDHDIRFVEDDWESPTLGAWGLGWEVWCDGMEVSQFTYFQQIGGYDCRPVTGEITYGLERLAMFIQDVPDAGALRYDRRGTTYGEVHDRQEYEQSMYNFQLADTGRLLTRFEAAEKECTALLQAGESQGDSFALPAYEQCIKASHLFNLLDARGVISVSERQSYILRVRMLATGCCKAYMTHLEREHPAPGSSPAGQSARSA